LLSSTASQQRAQKQKPASKAQPGFSEEAEQLRLSAISLLHSLAQTANEIEAIGDRVTVLAEIGDAFWPVDREYARTVLLRSFKEIDKLIPGVDDDNKRVASVKRHLRQLVLSRIAKHEPAFARELIQDQAKEAPTANEKAVRFYGGTSPSAEALLGIAQTFIATDPKRAATIASYSLQDGLSQRLRLFLTHLRAKDSDVADVLVTAAISEAGRQHPGNLFDVLVLWDYVYQPTYMYFNNISWNREKNELRANTSAEMKRLVLAFAVTAIVENLQQLPTDESAQSAVMIRMQLGALHSVIKQLLPNIQVDLPSGAVDLQQALVRVEQELRAHGESPPSPPPPQDSDAETSAIEKLIEKATEASQGEPRDNLYLEASLKLFRLDQYERAKEVASKIDDQKKRAMILEPVNFRLSAELVEKKSLQDAWNVANQLKTTEFRICALARVGRAFLDSGDSQSGMQALNAAQSLVSKADPSIQLAAAALRLAAAFSNTEPARVNEAIALAIQVMNRVKQDDTPWILMASTGREDSLTLNWKYSPGRSGGVSFVEAALSPYGGFADVLARLDFNEAIALAKTVNRKPLSMMAQASICRRLIESSHKEAPKAQEQ
jgi:hypothetical protein